MGIYTNSLKGKIITINFEFFERNRNTKIKFKGGARISGLTNINLIAAQTLNDVFAINLANDESRLLFSETISFNGPRGVGVWKKPQKGGTYRENGGQIVFISGRPYRYNSQDLRSNIEYILENFFNESEIPVSISENSEIIYSYNLYQNYPNPFNPSTTISYDLVKESKVELNIFNLLGQKVKTLVNEVQNTGKKSVMWNGENSSGGTVSSGIYFYNINVGDWTQIRKMIFK